ncbi:MAG TPA: exodeoxyribonuclease VII small subunit [Verrucomicrobiota bacterium]|nr:exodeoxyribonuclease VII small subunit [Verrucomicrobiota bacterium]HNU52089.1 exodeoxyribonuclease VII small subunit [Verrucomicrobiota bacterium]
MSKATKTSPPTAGGGSDLPFEETLRKLEAIVTSLESDDLPLETLMARYEEGVRLAEACQTRLAAAEARIRKLERDAAGESHLAPIESEANPPTPE